VGSKTSKSGIFINHVVKLLVHMLLISRKSQILFSMAQPNSFNLLDLKERELGKCINLSKAFKMIFK